MAWQARASRGALALAFLALVSCSESSAGTAPGAEATQSSTSTGAGTTTDGAGGAATTSTGDPATATATTTGSGGASVSTNGVTTTAAGETTTTGTASTTGGAGGTSSDVIQALREYLAIERAERPSLESQPFAQTALTASQAETARELFWEDHAAFVTETRESENSERSITLEGQTLIYDYTVFGDEPAGGHSLFISLHGGGEADASVNDEQWENQKVLYQPDEGIYLAPRAPTNTWNLWHEPHIDPLFDRLITNLIVFERVDPNRVYVMGYSAGGDGVYQLGPRMADYWAAAAMMAGHPNDAKPESLRNIGFTIHVGGLDTSFDRNLVAEQWGGLLDALEEGDPGGYPHYVEIHPDKPHWMDLEDAVAVPWMADFTRNPVPERVVWLQDDVTHPRFYWLSVDDAQAGTLITASYAGQTVELEADVPSVTVRLSDAMLDLDAPVIVQSGGSVLFEGMVERSLVTLQLTTEERGDPALVFSASITVALP